MCNKHSSTVIDSQSGEIIRPNCSIVVVNDDGDDDKVPQNPHERDYGYVKRAGAELGTLRSKLGLPDSATSYFNENDTNGQLPATTDDEGY